jgi:ATP-dependent Clp protease ATP-binding subunit ClpC
MFVPFTDRVREVMNLAEQEARRLKHEYVGTEHILLGLFKAQPGVGVTVLRNLGAEPDRVTFRVESIVQPGETAEEAIEKTVKWLRHGE